VKTYIGDGVYVEVKDNRLILTTEDGVTVTNTIFLEVDVWLQLRQVLARHNERQWGRE